MVARENDPWGTIAMRKFACRYLAGMRGSRPFRDAVARRHTQDSSGSSSRTPHVQLISRCRTPRLAHASSSIDATAT